MIEMVVRAIQHDPRSDQAVVVLEARAAGLYPRLVLTIMADDADGLGQELRSQETLRGRTFSLLTRILAGPRDHLAAVEIVPCGNRVATAWLWLESAGGRFRLPIEVGHALSLAVRLGIRLCVSRALLTVLATGAPAPRPDWRPEVPAPFRHAFGG